MKEIILFRQLFQLRCSFPPMSAGRTASCNGQVRNFLPSCQLLTACIESEQPEQEMSQAFVRFQAGLGQGSESNIVPLHLNSPRCPDTFQPLSIKLLSRQKQKMINAIAIPLFMGRLFEPGPPWGPWTSA